MELKHRPLMSLIYWKLKVWNCINCEAWIYTINTNLSMKTQKHDKYYVVFCHKSDILFSPLRDERRKCKTHQTYSLACFEPFVVLPRKRAKIRWYTSATIFKVFWDETFSFFVICNIMSYNYIKWRICHSETK